jgi:putative transposase
MELMREGEKALDDKVMPYIERDLSEINVGDILVADGHRLNFQVINPFASRQDQRLSAFWTGSP